MDGVRFTFASFTYANKAKKILSRGNIKSKLVKLGTDDGAGGCTHGLIVEREYFYAAIGILRREKIAYKVLDRIL